MRRTQTIVIGGGQAGLAMSRCLQDRGIDHVVLERGRVAERWRSERWDSLRLLTPNWQSRLPGLSYRGPDPDGYMTMPEVVTYLERYAASIRAPLETGTTVLRVHTADGNYVVRTDRGVWASDVVVIATGYCDVPHVPAMAARLASDTVQIVPTRYRRPGELPDGGVLIVGASASGVQLADEIHAAGRPVTIAVGRHTRLPRCYREKDILWWLDAMGLLDATADDVFDFENSREQPSLQLVGRPDHASLDLAILQSRGVRVVGRVLAIDGAHVSIDADDLLATTVSADTKLATLLARIDRFAADHGMAGQIGPAEPFHPIWPVIDPSPASVDLRADGIRTVIWATGFDRRYPWLEVPVLDSRGEIRHRGGVTSAAGLYVLGLQFQRRRKSAFIDGVGDDARELAADIAKRLARRGRRPRQGGRPMQVMSCRV